MQPRKDAEIDGRADRRRLYFDSTFLCVHLHGVIESPPANVLDCGRHRLRGKANLIPFLGAAHEGRKLGVEARGGLEERRMADALVDRELGAGDHLRRVFGGD